MNTPKGTPLAKEEVTLLIDLIRDNKIITSKATNATNNQLKEVAWQKITEDFNASISSCPRRIDQLKLKWENLKKATRKRSASIKFNHNKTGNGKPSYIPPDDALDRVASILGATCQGYTVNLGGDAEPMVTDLDFRGAKRKRKLDEDDINSRIARNQAITDYYNEKRRRLQLESENLELRNRKLKLELEISNE